MDAAWACNVHALPPCPRSSAPEAPHPLDTPKHTQAATAAPKVRPWVRVRPRGLVAWRAPPEALSCTVHTRTMFYPHICTPPSHARPHDTIISHLKSTIRAPSEHHHARCLDTVSRHAHTTRAHARCCPTLPHSAPLCPTLPHAHTRGAAPLCPTRCLDTVSRHGVSTRCLHTHTHTHAHARCCPTLLLR
jgi:hypothetical protein